MPKHLIRIVGVAALAMIAATTFILLRETPTDIDRTNLTSSLDVAGEERHVPTLTIAAHRAAVNLVRDTNVSTIATWDPDSGEERSRITIHFNGQQFIATQDAVSALRQFRDSIASPRGALAILGFERIPSMHERAALEKYGIRLLQYLADFGWVARISSTEETSLHGLPDLSAFAALDVSVKVSPNIYEECDCDELPVYVHLAADSGGTELLEQITQTGFTGWIAKSGGPQHFLAGRVDPVNLDLFLDLVAPDPDVQFIERGGGARLLNDTSAKILQSGSYAGTRPIWDEGIYGSNQMIAICDTGIDVDSCFYADLSGMLPPTNDTSGTNVNPSLRKVIAADFLYSGDFPPVHTSWDNNGHGTRVAGHAAGANISAPFSTTSQNGMAPAALLITQDAGFTVIDDCADLVGLGCPVTNFLAALEQAVAQGATLHNNSWGDNENGVFGPFNEYTETCREADWVTWNHKQFLVVCAAGNGGPGNNTVASPSTAKNALSVAATRPGVSQESLATFSSRGWTSDGRIKPDVAAPGQTVRSSLSDSSVITSNCTTQAGSGTSYASPMVAGLGALTRDYFQSGFYPTGSRIASNGLSFISAALVKAVIINAGMHMTGASAPPPSRDQGWGRVNLSQTLAFTNATQRLWVVDHPPLFDGSGTESYKAYLNIRSTNTALKVTLCWSDYPGTAGAGKQLVNDLDLEVRTPTLTFAGNALSNGWSYAGGAADRTNNVEQVVWNVSTTGLVEVCVNAHITPMPTQDFAVVATGDFEAWSTSRDVDGDGLPDYWEAWCLGGLQFGAADDNDNDGATNLEEYSAGTDPADSDDVLAITYATPHSNGVFEIQWPSVDGKAYHIVARSNLFDATRTTISSNLPASAPLNTSTLQAPATATSFIEIEVAE
jgi:hypothetical protein